MIACFSDDVKKHRPQNSLFQAIFLPCLLQKIDYAFFTSAFDPCQAGRGRHTFIED
jgi:hypothetical protein